MHRRTLTRWVAGAALASAQTAVPSAAAQRVKLETSLGVITLELDAQKAPKTVANFVQYVKDKHYDGTVFHRVIDGFMIQGGGFTADMQQKPTRPSIQNEADNGLKNLPLTVAMARTNDPHSASAQFFINVADNRFLNHTQPTLNGWGYAVFGKVVAGADVVDKIRQVRTGNRGMFQDLPTTPVTILKATLEK
ncbi:peptidylprolyl isomerase [Malikia spinosa]|uniref:Peptidyl-prolyl cis-trans isomerase n=1 Tax=Malikia spinosa TaxID=86180 RepID=A0A7C9J1F1_9BURK|nr:peptidylprolyl isomerase [Malikia spinosa]MYZ51055.1 peptidyl-prolyl cis-trans isomerase [Malikia spinosa]